MKKVCRKEMRVGEVCNDVDLVCEDCAVCAGNASERRCVRSLPLGHVCGTDRFAMCETGLKCVSGTCLRVVPEGKDCAIVGSICETGTRCIGPRQRKVCVVGAGVGQECGANIYDVCQRGMICKSGMCTKRISVGDDCSKVGTECPRYTVCMVQGSVRRCTMLPRLFGPVRWCFFSATGSSQLYLNGRIMEDVRDVRRTAMFDTELNQGDVISIIARGGGQSFYGAIAAVGPYLTGHHRWRAIRAEGSAYEREGWMESGFDACGWPLAVGVPQIGLLGKGRAAYFPYWTGALYTWAKDATGDDSVFLRFELGEDC